MTARNGSIRLKHLQDSGATIFDLDVTAPQSELDSKVELMKKVYGGLDVLINNAAYAESGPVEEVR